MAIQVAEGGEKGRREGGNVPVIISGTQTGQPVKKATDKIVSNSVSIDVNVRKENESYCHAVCKHVSFEKKGVKENRITKYLKSKTEGLTRTQLAILCIFPFVEFFAASVISIQGPFYPDTARRKGATPSEYGMVFGSFEIVVFIMAPIYGMKMGALNPHRLFNYGIFTTSLTCVLFGFVHHIEDRVAFILTSLIIRVIEAVGDAAFVIASFSIIAVEFPDTVATTFAMMETFYGLGMIAGPTVGGALYEVGGFTLPFATMGGLLFICAIATYKYITRVTTGDVEKGVSVYGFNMFKMLKIPVILLTAYGTFAAATGIGFLSNNLEHHLESFGLDKFKVGCIFMLNGGVYALSAPVWGRLCDKTKQLKIYSLLGSLFTIAGWALVGPLPFIPSWEPSIPWVCIGLIIFGLGLGSTLVSAFVQFLTDALDNGYPDDVSTYGLVSGLWTSMTALGFFVGPTIGGFLDHAVGFRWGTLFIFAEQIILIGCLLIFFRTTAGQAPKDDPKKPIKKDKDNKDDIVITYAVKMNTPKPQARKRRSSQQSAEAQTRNNNDAVINENVVYIEEAVPTPTTLNPSTEPISSVEKTDVTTQIISSASKVDTAPVEKEKTQNSSQSNLAAAAAGTTTTTANSIVPDHASEKIINSSSDNNDSPSSGTGSSSTMEGMENPSFVSTE